MRARLAVSFIATIIAINIMLQLVARHAVPKLSTIFDNTRSGMPGSVLIWIFQENPDMPDLFCRRVKILSGRHAGLH